MIRLMGRRRREKQEQGRKKKRPETAGTETKLLIVVVGRLHKYTRLDYTISPFEAISGECEREKGREREGDQGRRVVI